MASPPSVPLTPGPPGLDGVQVKVGRGRMEIPEPAQGLRVPVSAPGNDNVELTAETLSSSSPCPLFWWRSQFIQNKF